MCGVEEKCRVKVFLSNENVSGIIQDLYYTKLAVRRAWVGRWRLEPILKVTPVYSHGIITPIAGLTAKYWYEVGNGCAERLMI